MVNDYDDDDDMVKKSVLHLVADDWWGKYKDNEEAQFEMLFTLISEYHVDEEITTTDDNHVRFHLFFFLIIDHINSDHFRMKQTQHTFRDFLALLPSRWWNSERTQKYSNRLTNFESYYRSPIKRWTHKYSVFLHLYPNQ